MQINGCKDQFPHYSAL